jgi:hypothetical protein
MTEMFVLNVGVNASVNELIVDVQTNGPVNEQHLARSRMKYTCPA